MLRAVAGQTDQKWVLLYLERWLKSPMQMPDGTLVQRKGVRRKGHYAQLRIMRPMNSAGLCAALGCCRWWGWWRRPDAAHNPGRG